MKKITISAAIIALSTAGAFAQQANDPNLRRDPAAPVQDNRMAPADPAMNAPAPAMNAPAMNAQSQPPPADQTPADTVNWVAAQQPGEWMSGEIIGATVYNAAADSLGDISELVLDENGQVDAVIIGVGGFLGIGAKDVGVPFDSIKNIPDEDGNPHLVLNVTTEALNDAPAYVRLDDQSDNGGVAADVTEDKDGDGFAASRDVDDNDPNRH